MPLSGEARPFQLIDVPLNGNVACAPAVEETTAVAPLHVMRGSVSWAQPVV